VPKTTVDSSPSKRNTRQRETIRQVFAAAGRPLSPQEVASTAQVLMPSLGIATVYRALKEFTLDGWLVAVGIAGGTRYELAKLGHHHHFHCQACDKAFDIAGCTDNVKRLAPKGFVVAGHELTLSGTCPSCAKQI
jgi:Fur family ferric uptake transcriptional regulator